MANGGIGKVPEFDFETDDWVVYSERLQEYIKANEIKEANKAATLLANLLRDLCSPDLPSAKTFNQLNELLQTHFSRQHIIWRERRKYHEATQNVAESVTQ